MRSVLAAAVALGLVVTGAISAGATSLGEFSTGITSPGAQMTYGPDGNVWFTEPAANKIAKITPAGVVTEYGAGITAAAGLGGITAGPDGNVWFTEEAAVKIGKITPAGTVTEYAAGVGGSPMGIVAGSDGNMWFTEPKVGTGGSDEIGRITTAGTLGTITTGVTNGSSPLAITAGLDGNVWFTEAFGGRIGKVTIPADTISEFAAGLSASGLQGIAAGSDQNLWVAEPGVNEIARVTTAGAAIQFSAGISASSQPTSIASGPDGSLWFSEPAGHRVGRIMPSGAVTEYSTGITAGSSPLGIVMGWDLNLWFTESGALRIGRVYQPGLRGIDVSSNNLAVNWSLVAGAGYSFAYAKAVDGLTADTRFATNWSGMKAAGVVRGAYLFFRENISPISQTDALLAAINVAGGYTPEDMAPVLDVETTDGASPATIATNIQNAAAHIQATIGVWPVIYTGYAFWFTNLANSSAYSADPLWIANWFVRSPAVPGNNWSGTGFKIWQYSDTGVVPGITGAVDINQASWTGLPLIGGEAGYLPAVSTSQYHLANSDGSTWQEIDAANLRVPLSFTTAQTALVTANADLFTANAGYNQDVGIFVSDNGGSDALLAWKESGGFAGTFSPNAAYVQAIFNMVASHAYTFKLKWKTNKPASGATIYAGAGNGPYSPTSLIAEIFPASGATVSAVSTTQLSLSGSNGTTWQGLDPTHLTATVTPTVAETAVIGANADLFTSAAGYNQDIAIFVSIDAGADTLVGWKESGGLAGTFSPNAAFVKAVYAMTTGHTYVFKLKWKTNKAAGSGVTIYAGAGPLAGLFSPTSLVVSLIPVGHNPYSAVSTSQYSLHGSDGATWQPIDAALNVTINPVANAFVILGANIDLWTANAGYNQDIGIFVSVDGNADQLLAWKESGGSAGTFSPNAAFAQGTYVMSAEHTYVFKLKWKTNKPASGATIFAAAGGAPTFSPTRLTLEDVVLDA